MTRIGDWMQTRSGRQFWPRDPRPEDFEILDIAHALSNVCRFGGHCKVFYSVAEHSVHVSRECPPEFALEGLLHDASEAYIGDMVRPLKRDMLEFKDVEKKIEYALSKRFRLTYPWPYAVRRADEGVLMAEQRDLLVPAPEPWIFEVWGPNEPPARPIEGWDPIKAQMNFLQEFTRLSELRASR